MIEKLYKADLISFDLETTSVIPMEAEIVGISFSIKNNQGYYIPIKYPEKEKNNFGDNDQNFVLDKLKNFFEDESQ